MTKNCENCGREYQVKAFRADQSFFCSRQCVSEGYVKRAAAKREEKERLRILLEPDIKGQRGPIRGPCPVCGFRFRSYHVKKYCSMRCLITTAEYKERMLKKNRELAQRRYVEAGFSSTNRLRKPCLECGKEFFVKPSTVNSKKYCSQKCYRSFMAERFDRWIANPQSIALPQGYDEFLLGEELPCLIQGCDWRGKHLGAHVNMTHGILARDFKKAAGFNLGTGLISIDIAEAMGEQKRNNPLNYGNLRPNVAGMPSPIYRDPEYDSLEGKEHRQKAVEVMKTEKPTRYLPCLYCGRKITQPAFGKRQYCNVSCRNKRYWAPQETREGQCNWCGTLFPCGYHQWLRLRKNLPVFCSPHCRQARNATIVPRKRREITQSAGR